jgi:hypothetical protein
MPIFSGFVVPQRGILFNATLELTATAAQARAQSGHAPIHPVQLRALLDIGADVTFVDQQTLTAMMQGVLPVRMGIIPSPQQAWQPTPVYLLHLSIQDPQGGQPFDLPTQEIHQGDFSLPYCQAVIGRDILSRCLLSYDGTQGVYALGW